MKSKPARITALVLIAPVLVVTLLLIKTPSSAQILQQPISQQPPEVELVRDLGIEVATLFQEEGVSFLFSSHFLENMNDLIAYHAEHYES